MKLNNITSKDMYNIKMEITTGTIYADVSVGYKVSMVKIIGGLSFDVPVFTSIKTPTPTGSQKIDASSVLGISITPYIGVAYNY